MNDRELLELAAKAAGIEVWFPRMSGGRNPDGTRIILTPCHTKRNGVIEEWNPLTDDGDALRLAVKLNISVHQDPRFFLVHADPVATPIEISEGYTLSKDPYAATRRAIVRAAAEIGSNT